MQSSPLSTSIYYPFDTGRPQVSSPPPSQCLGTQAMHAVPALGRPAGSSERTARCVEPTYRQRYVYVHGMSAQSSAGRALGICSPVRTYLHTYIPRICVSSLSCAAAAARRTDSSGGVDDILRRQREDVRPGVLGSITGPLSGTPVSFQSSAESARAIML